MINLKLCPFCGGEAILESGALAAYDKYGCQEYPRKVDGTRHVIKCTQCRIEGNTYYGQQSKYNKKNSKFCIDRHEARRKAIKAWNNRADLVEAPTSEEVQELHYPSYKKGFENGEKWTARGKEEALKDCTLLERLICGASKIYDEADKQAALQSVKTIRQALTAQKAQEWQPIETAPKDGTQIIAYGLCSFPYYDKKERKHLRKKAYQMQKIWWNHGSWCMNKFTSIEPTHWMPLPQPPTKESE